MRTGPNPARMSRKQRAHSRRKIIATAGMGVALLPSRHVQDPEVLTRAKGPLFRERSDRRRGSVRVAEPVGPGIGGEQAASGSRRSSTRGREAVEFFARCEDAGIKVRNCPAYVREWIASNRR